MDSATSSDILHLEVGQPDFSTPAPVIRSVFEAADKSIVIGLERVCAFIKAN